MRSISKLNDLILDRMIDLYDLHQGQGLEDIAKHNDKQIKTKKMEISGIIGGIMEDFQNIQKNLGGVDASMDN